MGLGGNSRMSRKSDLIIGINLERLAQGMKYKEIISQSLKLWRKKIEELEQVYKDLLVKRRDDNGKQDG